MTDQSDIPTEFHYRIAVLDKMVQMRSIIEKAQSHSREGHTFKDAFDLVASGRGMFWWTKNSCAVLEWRVHPAGKVIHCLWAGGKYKELLDLYEGVAAFAENNGAKGMTTLGRKGFLKRLPHEGWEVAGIWFYKSFEERT